MSFCQQLSEAWPPKPRFTEKDLGDRSGKVYIVTGGASGIGYELLKVLYPTGARLYLAGRSSSKATAAITAIKAAHPSVKNGFLEFLQLDLGDLTTIKASADAFLKLETRLDVLWLNAGVWYLSSEAKTAQGYEAQIGTNVLGHYLFTELLQPLLSQTAQARDSAEGSVRVIWVSSVVHDKAPPHGGINYDDINYARPGSTSGSKQWEPYGQSKAAAIILAREFARRYGDTGVLSLSLNPGNLKTSLQRHNQSLGMRLIYATVLFEPYYGAMTLLFAGCSPEVGPEKNGKYVIPWGRWGLTRKDVWEANGGRLWTWCEDQVGKYR